MKNKLRYELYTLDINAFGEVTHHMLWGTFCSQGDARTIDERHQEKAKRFNDSIITVTIDTERGSIESYLKSIEEPTKRILLLHLLENNIHTVNSYEYDGRRDMTEKFYVRQIIH